MRPFKCNVIKINHSRQTGLVKHTQHVRTYKTRRAWILTTDTFSFNIGHHVMLLYPRTRTFSPGLGIPSTRQGLPRFCSGFLSSDVIVRLSVRSCGHGIGGCHAIWGWFCYPLPSYVLDGLVCVESHCSFCCWVTVLIVCVGLQISIIIGDNITSPCP